MITCTIHTHCSGWWSCQSNPVLTERSELYVEWNYYTSRWWIFS